MIYTNPYPPERAIDDGEDPAMHVWLEGMVDETDEDEEERLVPQLSAMCGVHVEDLHWPGDIEPHVKPANETWANSLVDLLGHSKLCEECRTRAAVYFDRQEDVTLTAQTHDVPECPECEKAGRDSFKRTATIANIVQREDKTVVERAVECDECGHEWESHVDMGDL